MRVQGRIHGEWIAPQGIHGMRLGSGRHEVQTATFQPRPYASLISRRSLSEHRPEVSGAELTANEAQGTWVVGADMQAQGFGRIAIWSGQIVMILVFNRRDNRVSGCRATIGVIVNDLAVQNIKMFWNE